MQFARTHDGHEYGGRDEYSPEIAANPQDDTTALALEKLDEVIYAEGNSLGDGFYCETTSEMYRVERSFSYFSGNFKGWVWPLAETEVVIAHEFDRKLQRNRYSIAASWMIRNIEDHAAPMTTTYNIDVYPEGPLQTYVEYLAVDSEELEGRRMTPFDFADLYTELDKITDVQRSARRDNELSGTLLS